MKTPQTVEPQISHYRASRREWLCRFADRMVEASDYEMSLGEAVRLGAAEYEQWGGNCPEALVARFTRLCRIDQASAHAVPPWMVSSMTGSRRPGAGRVRA